MNKETLSSKITKGDWIWSKDVKEAVLDIIKVIEDHDWERYDEELVVDYIKKRVGERLI